MAEERKDKRRVLASLKKDEEAGRAPFWSAQRATERGKIFWVDIETTGLGKQVVEFGPSRFKEIFEAIEGQSGFEKKLDTLKHFDEFKYFDRVGLAQYVTHSRHKPGLEKGIAMWPHGAGYTSWKDTLHELLTTREFDLSEFAHRKGIIPRTIEAMRANKAYSEIGALSTLSKEVLDKNRTKLTLSGWNTWFDIFGTQAFMVRHAKALNKAGVDPFSLLKRFANKSLLVETAEDTYFDILRYRGLKDKDWATKHLRYGSKFARTVGKIPGAPISMAEDVDRVADRGISHLRGTSWKGEVLGSIFDEYGAITRTVDATRFPGNIHARALSYHDALRDIPTELALARRFKAAGKFMKVYDKQWGSLSKMLPGHDRGLLVSALGFARAGLLGEEKGIRGRGLSGQRYLQNLASNQPLLGVITKRAGKIWSRVEDSLKPRGEYMPGGPHEVIESKYGSYKRLLWGDHIGRETAEETVARGNLLRLKVGSDIERLGSRIADTVSNTIAGVKNMPTWGKAGAIGAGIFALYNAFGRTQSPMEANLPSNYTPGQQGRKVINVPWSSPYQGPSIDQDNALEFMAKGTGIGLGTWGLYNAPKAMHLFGKQDSIGKLYYGSRLAEDAFPFRIGRLLNVSSFFSSYMPTGESLRGIDRYTVPIEDLISSGRTTKMGSAYAKTFGMSDQELSETLSRGHFKKGLRFTRDSPSSAFFSVKLGKKHGTKSIRFFEAYSRLAHVYATMDTPGIIDGGQRSPKAIYNTMSRILYNSFDEYESALGRRIVRGLHSIPFLKKTVQGAVQRYSEIPLWEDDPFRAHQRTKAAGKNVLVPGYQKGVAGAGRAVKGLFTDFLMSGYSFARREAAIFGVKLPAATSPGRLFKGFAKAGVYTWGAVTGFGLVNDSLGGALTAPLRNVRERLMLTRASISDMTGLTRLRESMPDIQATSALAVGLTPLFGYLGYKSYHRIRALTREYKDAGLQGFPGEDRIWGKTADGPDYFSRREGSYIEGQSRANRAVKRFFIKQDSSLKGLSKLTGRGKVATGLFGLALGATLPFLLGSEYSRDELEEVYSGERLVPVRRGRWWELGASPYEGGRIAYWRRHQSARTRMPAEEEVAGSERGIIPAIKTLFSPYWRERASYHDRPYPVTGGLFEDVPLVGPLLAGTIGRWLKPPKFMHTDQWRSGDAYEQYGERLAPVGFGSAGKLAGNMLGKSVTLRKDPKQPNKDTYGRFLRHVSIDRGGKGEVGKVVSIVDGDTVDVLTSGGKIRVRMLGVNAPEAKVHELYRENQLEPKGLPSPTPLDPYGITAQVREALYKTTEFAGLRGYLAQAVGFEKLTGNMVPGENASYLQPARMGPNAVSDFWEADLGGMAGLNEVYRRFFPRPERGQEVNPLKNTMPWWLPDNEYFINFKQGDPYSKVPYGEERLPGPGYAALNPEVEGLDAANYPNFHKYKILADIAPWSGEIRDFKKKAYQEARFEGDFKRIEALDRISEQADAVKERRNFKEYSFLSDRETVKGVVSQITPSGAFKLAEYPKHTFTFSGVKMGASSAADQLRRNNNLTKEEASIRAAENMDNRQNFLNDLLLGSKVSVKIQSGGLMSPNVDGIVTDGLTNINRKIVSKGYGSSEGGAPTAGFLTRLYGGMMERLGHMPQHIPGPWMGFTKFMNQADPIEEYRRSQLYGSDSRFWDAPIENFIRPYALQTISKLTPGEFIPSHVKERREMETYLDRLKFLHSYNKGDYEGAGETMAGVDVYGIPEKVVSALPYNDRPFFSSFVKETDPEKRQTILSMASEDMQRALVGQWQSQYAQVSGESIPRSDTRSRIQLAAQLATKELRDSSRGLPDKNWIGWDPRVDFEDTKAVLVQHEGMDRHDFNIWDDRTNSLMRKPYLWGANEGLTSRRMPTNINRISREFDRTEEGFFPVETISYNTRSSFSVNNQTNYDAWMKQKYSSNFESMFR